MGKGQSSWWLGLQASACPCWGSSRAKATSGDTPACPPPPEPRPGEGGLPCFCSSLESGALLRISPRGMSAELHRLWEGAGTQVQGWLSFAESERIWEISGVVRAPCSSPLAWSRKQKPDVSLQPSGVEWLRVRALESDGLGSTPSSAIFELCPLEQIPKLLCASFPPLCGLAVRIKSENSSKVFSKGRGCESPE